ncbi:MAG: DUF512 domain-containing protein [Firmicutes bacterium]|nr:DUF512 domain-containing protein [Bacillota bacterium]
MIKHEILKVQENSIAAEMGIARGDFLLSINSEEVRDILDYRFRIQEEQLLVEIEKPNSEIWELDIEKEADDDLGIEFKQSLMSHTKRCSNNCVFCFVDQQPKGLRPSLYVKDDDPRLSFLLGNYVTLTNLDEAEIKRLAGYHLSPLRISVHAADLDLREKMMGTNKARNLFDALEVFNQAGTEMHFQIVLCKGLNDRAHLDYTIEKLMELKPGAKSLAIVPAGLTRYREGLFPLQSFTKEDAHGVIAQAEKWQKNSRFVFLSDEWYILAGIQLPNYKHYGDFPQLDNGVGVIRLFEHDFVNAMALGKVDCNKINHMINRGHNRRKMSIRVGIVTGTAAGAFMRSIAARFMAKHSHYIKIAVYEIENDFFGSSINVSGLLAGQDVINQLKNKLDKTNVILMPDNAFRAGVKQKIMLDGVTREDLERELNVRVRVGHTDGAKFYKQLRALLPGNS